MKEKLRYGATYNTKNLDTFLDFSDELNFEHLVELCFGCGTCRETIKNQMCPTFRVTKDEIMSTRARANLMRAAISGEIPEQEMYTKKFKKEILDLCVACKACMADCLSGVNLAKLRTELKYQIHQKHSINRREKFFAEIDDYLALGSKFAPLSNWAMKIPGAKSFISNRFGIAKERKLPGFTRNTFTKWFRKNSENKVSEEEAEHKAVIFPDPYTDYVWPEAGKATVRVLQEAGVYVEMAQGVTGSGRPANSKGFLEEAEKKAKQNVAALAPKVDQGFDVVLIEPSDSVMLQHDYLSYLEGEDVEKVAENSYEVTEYIDQKQLTDNLQFRPTNQRLAYHPNCNQEAMNQDEHAANTLKEAGYQVDHLDTTCCGMAGSFGYEKEHYEISKALATLLENVVEESGAEEVVTPGFSCRKQVRDMLKTTAVHPVRKLDEATQY